MSESGVNSKVWEDYDDNMIEYVFGCMERSEFAPYFCPECGQKSVHLYMQVHNLNTRRGGLWIWCSSCHNFLHSSHYIPLNWSNFTGVETEKLCAVPAYLDELKIEIDTHLNMHIEQIYNKGM